jgi:hypothetical protein
MCVCCQKVIVFKIEFEICRIITQPRLPWWPQIDLVYNKSSDLRLMFTDTLNKALQGCITHTTLRMIPVTEFLLNFVVLILKSLLNMCLRMKFDASTNGKKKIET